MKLSDAATFWQGGLGPQKIKIDDDLFYIIDQHVEQSGGPVVSAVGYATREDAEKAAAGRPFSKVVSGKTLNLGIRAAIFKKGE